MTDREQVIAKARQIDSATFVAEIRATGPGRFEGTDDLALVVALDIIDDHGFADEVAGDVEGGTYMARVGQYVLCVDDRGFVSVVTFNSNADAIRELEHQPTRRDTA